MTRSIITAEMCVVVPTAGVTQFGAWPDALDNLTKSAMVLMGLSALTINMLGEVPIIMTGVKSAKVS